VLTFSTKSFGQADAHVLVTVPFYKRQLLAGHFQVEHQQSHKMTHNRYSCYEKINLNRFCEVEPVELSTMTAQQQACEEHSHPHNPTIKWKICGQTSNQDGTQSTLSFSPLQSKDYMPLNANWKEIQTLRFTTTAS